MLPMKCPKCSSSALRVPSTNNQLDDQVMRKRVCLDCGHRWFTVELIVPDYAVGWSAARNSGKPVLRTPLTLNADHVEVQDSMLALRAWNKRGKARNRI